jgi:hypothetical protein
MANEMTEDVGGGCKWLQQRSPELLSPVTPLGSESSYSVTSTDVRDDRRSTTTAGDEEICLICGDRASGYHYNALSCEGCKGRCLVSPTYVLPSL